MKYLSAGESINRVQNDPRWFHQEVSRHRLAHVLHRSMVTRTNTVSIPPNHSTTDRQSPCIPYSQSGPCGSQPTLLGNCAVRGGGVSSCRQTGTTKEKETRDYEKPDDYSHSVTYLHRITSVCPVCRYFRRCREGWMDKNIMISVCTKPDWRDGRYVMQGVWNLFAHVWLGGRGEMGSFYCM